MIIGLKEDFDTASRFFKDLSQEMEVMIQSIHDNHEAIRLVVEQVVPNMSFQASLITSQILKQSLHLSAVIDDFLLKGQVATSQLWQLLNLHNFSRSSHGIHIS